MTQSSGVNHGLSRNQPTKGACRASNADLTGARSDFPPSKKNSGTGGFYPLKPNHKHHPISGNSIKPHAHSHHRHLQKNGSFKSNRGGRTSRPRRVSGRGGGSQAISKSLMVPFNPNTASALNFTPKSNANQGKTQSKSQTKSKTNQNANAMRLHYHKSILAQAHAQAQAQAHAQAQAQQQAQRTHMQRIIAQNNHSHNHKSAQMRILPPQGGGYNPHGPHTHPNHMLRPIMHARAIQAGIRGIQAAGGGVGGAGVSGIAMGVNVVGVGNGGGMMHGQGMGQGMMRGKINAVGMRHQHQHQLQQQQQQHQHQQHHALQHQHAVILHRQHEHQHHPHHKPHQAHSTRHHLSNQTQPQQQQQPQPHMHHLHHLNLHGHPAKPQQPHQTVHKHLRTQPPHANQPNTYDHTAMSHYYTRIRARGMKPVGGVQNVSGVPMGGAGMTHSKLHTNPQSHSTAHSQVQAHQAQPQAQPQSQPQPNVGAGIGLTAPPVSRALAIINPKSGKPIDLTTKKNRSTSGTSFRKFEATIIEGNKLETAKRESKLEKKLKRNILGQSVEASSKDIAEKKLLGHSLLSTVNQDQKGAVLAEKALKIEAAKLTGHICDLDDQLEASDVESKLESKEKKTREVAHFDEDEEDNLGRDDCRSHRDLEDHLEHPHPLGQDDDKLTAAVTFDMMDKVEKQTNEVSRQLKSELKSLLRFQTKNDQKENDSKVQTIPLDPAAAAVTSITEAAQVSRVSKNDFNGRPPTTQQKHAFASNPNPNPKSGDNRLRTEADAKGDDAKGDTMRDGGRAAKDGKTESTANDGKNSKGGKEGKSESGSGDGSRAESGAGAGSGDGTESGSGSGAGGSGSAGSGSQDDSVGGPYMPHPIKQNRVAKRKKIVFTREQLMPFQSKCTALPKGFPTELMKEIVMTEPILPSPTEPSPSPHHGSLPGSLGSAGSNGIFSLEGGNAGDHVVPGNGSGGASGDLTPAGAAGGVAGLSGSRVEKGKSTPRVSPQITPKRAPNAGGVSGLGALGPSSRGGGSSGGGFKPLTKSANRWTPSSSRMSLFDKLMQKVTGILNKMSPEPGKHEGLFEKLYELVKHHCRSSEELVGICNQVFDKAVTEASYSNLYAKLSLELANRCPTFRVEKKLADGRKISRVAEFKTIMLTKCQKEFQGNSKQILKLQERIIEAKDNDIKELLSVKLKKRRRGNVRFIGELFKVGLEAKKMERVLHTCIQHLLRDIRQPEEEDIVCLEVLLNTAGRQLDTPKAKRYMNQYFKRIINMSTNLKLPNRLNFKCKDLVDLRKRNWNTRRGFKAPARSIRTDDSHRGPQHHSPHHQGLGGLGAKRREPVPLPRRVGNRYGGFGTGTNAGSSGTSPAGPRLPTSDTSTPQGGETTVALVSNVTKKPVASILAGASSGTGLGSSGVSGLKDSSVSFAPKPEMPVEDQVEKDVNSLVMEFWGCGKRGLGEAALCIEELGSKDHHWMVVKQSILLSLEKKERERKLTLELLVWLFVTKKMLTSQDFEKGLRPIFEDLGEIQVDIPHAGKLVRAMCQAFVKYKCIGQKSLDFLSSLSGG
mmetsp:Transcript_494/g.716  ORF Transcript_494/g.716 Transcript_494/m.716 type:complete len:1558 (-) Transcript_494:155-4828(-)